MDEFLTVSEIAELLKLNQQTIRNWIDAGKLPAFRIGRRVRVKREDFERLLEESYSGRSGGDSAPADAIWSGEVPLPDSAAPDEATE
jgi:putative molybdopterin biosynthesis protein